MHEFTRQTRYCKRARDSTAATPVCSFVTQVVKDVARVPVWAKLTPATGDIVVEAGAVFRGGGDAVSSSNTFPSLPQQVRDRQVGNGRTAGSGDAISA